MQEVLSSAQVAPVTTKLECAKLADGAAALVLVPAAAVGSSGSSRGAYDMYQRHLLMHSCRFALARWNCTKLHSLFVLGTSLAYSSSCMALLSACFLPADASELPTVDNKMAIQTTHTCGSSDDTGMSLDRALASPCQAPFRPVQSRAEPVRIYLNSNCNTVSRLGCEGCNSNRC